jgi:DNA invertase Pin-like site-specific DNA recombinase
MEKRTRVGLYARVSTKDQHCSQQLQEIRAYVEARGWEVAGEFVDRGLSGAKNSRPAMNRLMDAARRRQIDAVICSKMDRWGRSMPHFVSTVQELRGLGVRFIAVSQGIDTDESNPAARLMLNMLAAFSEFERELIVERTLAGLARARRHGRVGGRPRVVCDRSKIERLHEEGKTLVEIADRVGISKSSVHRLLRRL